MQIDQRRVATISLQQEPKREVYLHPEGRGYRLCLVARDEAVNILLSVQDVQKLRRALGTLDLGDSSREFAFAESENRHMPSSGREMWFICQPNRLNWKELDWLCSIESIAFQLCDNSKLLINPAWTEIAPARILIPIRQSVSPTPRNARRSRRL